MNKSMNENCKESLQAEKEHSEKTMTQKSNISVSEIEKLYLRIKEDWL